MLLLSINCWERLKSAYHLYISICPCPWWRRAGPWWCPAGQGRPNPRPDAPMCASRPMMRCALFASLACPTVPVNISQHCCFINRCVRHYLILLYGTIYLWQSTTTDNNTGNWQLCQVYCTKWRASAIHCVCVWVSVRMRVNFFRISIQFFTLNTFRSLRLHIYQIYIVWISLSTQFHFNTYLIPLFIFLLSSLFE